MALWGIGRDTVTSGSGHVIDSGGCGMAELAKGRPSKYNDEIQTLADRYIFEYQSQDDVIPSAAGLCVWLGISRPTLHEWDKKYPAFSNTLDAIRSLQEKAALNKGLTGEFNSTIVKLVLANHGYSDKLQQDVTSSDGSMSPTRIELVAPSEK